ncbi:hypothetical protein HAX54_021372, partial [Datura stramonium]|nr:hypothetical protein [Datura stramonium]
RSHFWCSGHISTAANPLQRSGKQCGGLRPSPRSHFTGHPTDVAVPRTSSSSKKSFFNT